MNPLPIKNDDHRSLLTLGRASAQIVHDLKNQLNGLKLYATFLRKRLDKSGRPADELETLNKLMAGLDRAAADLSMIAQFGQPVELRKHAGVDLEKLLRGVAESLNESPGINGALSGPILLESGPVPLVGEFDADNLREALKSISVGAMKICARQPHDNSLHIRLRDEIDAKSRSGVIEWKLSYSLDYDPFRSFANSDEIRMSLAARVIEAHGGSADRHNVSLRVRLPLTTL